MSKLLRFKEYQPSWVDDFKQIETYLDRFLGNLVIDIHHVGSTSVKQLGAKPIIDVDIEYQEYFNEIKQLLIHNDYQYEGEKGIKGRYSFRFMKDTLPEHHLYLIHSDCNELKKHLTFKDALTRFPMYRKLYHQTKEDLINRNNKDRVLYTESKTDVINFIMKESDRMKSIVFAGGCFWGVEAYFKMIEGVVDTEVGYIAGNGETSYKEVCAGSGHAEAVYIQYDGDKVNLKTLLDHLFNIIDPTSINKQGPDIGVQYRTGIYNYTNEELLLINKYIETQQPNYKKPIALELKTNLEFFSAEDYHQDYLDKNANGYCHVDLASHKNVK